LLVVATSIEALDVVTQPPAASDPGRFALQRNQFALLPLSLVFGAAAVNPRLSLSKQAVH
jgi:hypothetical protein